MTRKTGRDCKCAFMACAHCRKYHKPECEKCLAAGKRCREFV